MIHWLRTWRHASPALVTREPGYCTKGWISTPFSAPGRLPMPGLLPESCTPRQNGALLPGWVFARTALVSSGLGSGAAAVLAGAAKRGAGAVVSCDDCDHAAPAPTSSRPSSALP